MGSCHWTTCSDGPCPFLNIGDTDNISDILSAWFYHAVMPQYNRPSVCPSVTFSYPDHIGWQQFRALIYRAHRAVVPAIAWHLVSSPTGADHLGGSRIWHGKGWTVASAVRELITVTRDPVAGIVGVTGSG